MDPVQGRAQLVVLGGRERPALAQVPLKGLELKNRP
jgi:hypothetical protein